MPSDTPAGRDGGVVAEDHEDELTFAVQDLGRDRATPPVVRALDFAPSSPAPVPAPTPAVPSGEDGFVIRQPHGVAPAAPVDALVVGATEPEAPAAPAVATPPTSFMITSASMAAASPTAEELWTTREPAPATPAPQPSRRGWATRHSELVDRSAQATMLRLREEAVNVSWKAAWIAATSADPRLLRKRRSQSP